MPQMFCRLLFQDSQLVLLILLFQDLSKLGRDLKHVLIVDNSPASYSFHPENAVSAFVFFYLPQFNCDVNVITGNLLFAYKTQDCCNFQIEHFVRI